MQKGSSIVFALLLGCSLPSMQAEEHSMNQTSGYQTATVISVDRYTYEPYYGGAGTDAPLQVRAYSYDVGIRLDCKVYIGRYKSATRYLPFSPNQQIDVRLHKHILYVSLPFSDEEVRMGIVGHRRVKDEACSAPTAFSGHTINHHPSEEGKNKGAIL